MVFFDIHFLNSKTHGTNRVDTNHQNAVKTAAEWAEKEIFNNKKMEKGTSGAFFRYFL